MEYCDESQDADPKLPSDSGTNSSTSEYDDLSDIDEHDITNKGEFDISEEEIRKNYAAVGYLVSEKPPVHTLNEL